MSLPFKNNPALTIGVELELQLINLQDFNLAMESRDFIRRISEIPNEAEIKPEITQGMIELNSSIHSEYNSLISELLLFQKLLAKEAQKAHLGICGGGTHPFQKWKDQRIFRTKRFTNTSEQYGYLAKQFTVFGQHIHIGCNNGDDAIYLCHALAKYLPHFVALSASSPFQQGVDTAFDCSRLAIINAFPLSGTIPWVLNWDEFIRYYNQMQAFDIVSSIKDFYWDIRPKPEYGTVEIRICDTPLTTSKAADLAAYAQVLAAYLLDQRPVLSKDVYLTYDVNRFRATRYGLAASLIDPIHGQQSALSDEILSCCNVIGAYAKDYNAEEALENIRKSISQQQNGATWLRNCYEQYQSFPDVVREQVTLWLNESI